MDKQQILNAYIDEYYVREVIKVKEEGDASARLELPDRIIHLVCDERGIIESKTHKRRGIPFMEHPVGLKRLNQDNSDAPVGDEEVSQNVTQDVEKQISVSKEQEDLPGQITISDFLGTAANDKCDLVKSNFKEGTLVCSIYNKTMVFKVIACHDNVITALDEKTSTTHQIAIADVAAVQKEEPGE